MGWQPKTTYTSIANHPATHTLVCGCACMCLCVRVCVDPAHWNRASDSNRLL